MIKSILKQNNNLKVHLMTLKLQPVILIFFIIFW